MKKITYLFLFMSGLLLAPALGISQSSPSAGSYNDIEVFVAKLKAQHIFKTVMERTGASKEEMKMFYKFYQDSIIGRDRTAFAHAIHNGKIKNDADIKAYANKKIPEYISMFNRFEALRKSAPSIVDAGITPQPPPPVTCNTGCNNFDFSSGTLAEWTACYAENTSTSSSSSSSGGFSNTAWTCFGPLAGGTESADDPSTSSYQVSVMSGTGNDPFAGAFLPLVPPGCTHSCRIGDSTNPFQGMAMIENTFMVSAAQPFVNYYYAVLLENPSHPYYEQPYFWSVFLDQNGDTIPSCGKYFVVSGPGLPGFSSFYYPTDGDTVYVRPWTYQYVSLRNYIGQCVTVHVIASDCALGGHFGYGYFEGICGQYSLSATPVVCGSNNAILTAPGGAQSYQWTGPCIVGATNTQTVAVSCAGTYSVAIIDNLTNPCPDTLTVTVTTAPAFYLNPVSSTNVRCGGQNTGSITASASGGTLPYTYSWSPANGTNVSASGLSAGTYTLYARDAAGCNDSLVVTLTQPTPITATISTTQTPCGANAGSATVAASGGASAYTYRWAPSGSTNVTATGLSAGIYTITITDVNGCTLTSTAIVTSLTALTVTATTTNVNCNGTTGGGSATASTSNGVTPYTYTWAPSGGSNATATGLSAGTYTVSVTDANGCEGNTTVTITQPSGVTISTSSTQTSCAANIGTATVTASGGTPAYTYSWTPSGNTNATATGLSVGTYTVSVTDATGCSVTAAVTVIQPNSFTLAVSATQSTCSANNGAATVFVTGGTPVFTYSWAPSGNTTATATGLSAGTYTVTVTDANGCIQSITTTVNSTSSQPLTVAVTGATSFCPGGSTNLEAIVTGGYGNYSYLWSPGNSSIQNITVSPSATTTYTIQITDACGTTVTDTVTVFINPSPQINFNANPVTGCVPLCIQFRNLTTLSSGSITHSNWGFGDGDTATGLNPIHCYNSPGSFNVSLTAISNDGCSSSLNRVSMINVYPHPDASFTYSPQPVSILSPVVQFTDNSASQYPIIYWNWTFGDGSGATSSLRNPSYQYSDTGTYCATLVVGNQYGCVDTATNCLVVNPIFTLYIPDAFSPNGDGVNDIFMVKGSFIQSFEMYIFDRWGMELFHTTDIMNGWKGSVNNNSTVCQEDTYVYQINITDTKGNKHAYTGTLNLIK